MMKPGKSTYHFWFAILNPTLLQVLFLLFTSAGVLRAESLTPPAGADLYGYRVIKTYPHDSNAFTQGLIYKDGFFFESTGINGKSTLRKIRIETGQVILEHKLSKRHFAEGLTEFENRLIQLTWKSNIAFIYDLMTFKVLKTFSFKGEGWGLTSDGSRLFMSDGSAQLRILDPNTFKELNRISILHGNTLISELNELEFVKGEIFANLWHTDQIIRIDPGSGKIKGWIDLRGLLPKADQKDSIGVLNGIAYDAASDRLFVTGKFWPKVFEISLYHRR